MDDSLVRLVEFTGIPGSGKSALYRAVVHASRESGVRLETFTDVLLQRDNLWTNKWPLAALLRNCTENTRYRIAKREYSFFWRAFGGRKKFLRENFALIAAVERHFRLSPMREKHRQMRFDTFMLVAQRYQIADDHLPDSSAFVFDEGFTHRVVNLFVDATNRQVDEGGILDYLEYIPHVDILIRVTSSIETAIDRMRMRGLPMRLRDADDSMIVIYLENAALATEIAVDKLASNGTMLIEVNNEEALCTVQRAALGRRIYEDVLQGLERK
ncbi:MAG: hypothetical protein E4H01_05420 [Lysobacterales bacterium]|nr:MAG: hypothetical protein E4H01_05420 [Xanthomonadales bacterium]